MATRVNIDLTDYTKDIDKFIARYNDMPLLTDAVGLDVVKLGLMYLCVCIDDIQSNDVWDNLTNILYDKYVVVLEAYVTYKDADAPIVPEIESLHHGLPEFIDWENEHDLFIQAEAESEAVLSMLESFDIADDPVFNEIAYIVSNAVNGKYVTANDVTHIDLSPNKKVLQLTVNRSKTYDSTLAIKALEGILG